MWIASHHLFTKFPLARPRMSAAPGVMRVKILRSEKRETDELDKRREHKLGPRSAWFNDKNNRYVLPKMTFPGRNEFLNNKPPSPNNNRSDNNNNNNRDRDHGAAPRRR